MTIGKPVVVFMISPCYAVFYNILNWEHVKSTV